MSRNVFAPKCGRLTLCAVAVLLTAVPPAVAQTYLCEQDYKVALGKPIRLLDPNKDCRFSGAVASQVNADKPLVLDSFSLRAVVVTNESLFTRQTETDVALSVKGRVAGVAASARVAKSENRSNKRVTLVLTATFETPEQTVDEVDFTKRAAAEFQKAGRPEEFQALWNKYGTDVVTSVRRGGRIYVLYNYECSSAEKARDVEAKLNAKAGAGIRYGGKLNFHDIVKTADQHAEESISFDQYGGVTANGMAAIAQAAHGDVDGFIAAVSGVLRGIQPENLPITSFGTTSLADLPGAAGSPVANAWKDFRPNGFRKDPMVWFGEEYEKLLQAERQTRLALMLNNALGDSAKVRECENFLAKTNTLHEELRQTVLELRSKVAPPPERPDVQRPIERIVPPPPPPLVVAGEWRFGPYTVYGNIIAMPGAHSQWHLFIYNFPTVTIPKPDLVQSITLYRRPKHGGLREAVTQVIQGEDLAKVARWGAPVPPPKRDGDPHPEYKTYNEQPFDIKWPTDGLPMEYRGDPIARLPDPNNAKEKLQDHWSKHAAYKYFWEVVDKDGKTHEVPTPFADGPFVEWKAGNK